MKKRIKEYNEKYDHIPNNFTERFNYIIHELKLTLKDISIIKKALLQIRKVKWETIDFVFYFYPQATARPRVGKKRIFYVKDAKNYNDIFKDFIDTSDELHHIITTPCRFYCDLYMRIPENLSKIEKIIAELQGICAIIKPDWDNGGKTYSDMIQKHLLLDDCLIVDGRVRKFYSFKPRIELHIEYMEKYDCKFNKKKVEKWKTYIDNIDNILEKDYII